jgi:hypothetical protein
MASMLQTACPDAIRQIQRVQTVTIAWIDILLRHEPDEEDDEEEDDHKQEDDNEEDDETDDGYSE